MQLVRVDGATVCASIHARTVDSAPTRKWRHNSPDADLAVLLRQAEPGGEMGSTRNGAAWKTVVTATDSLVPQRVHRIRGCNSQGVGRHGERRRALKQIEC